MEEEVNAAHAAILVGRSEKTIRRHITNGTLAATKTHYGFRIRVTDLMAAYSCVTEPPPRLVQHPVQQPRPVRLVQHTRPRLVQQLPKTFPNHAEAARWLVVHGLHSEYTPKSWRNWMDVELTPEAVLAKAIKQCDTSNHRIPWRLAACGDISCVCATMLGSSGPALS